MKASRGGGQLMSSYVSFIFGTRVGRLSIPELSRRSLVEMKKILKLDGSFPELEQQSKSRCCEILIMRTVLEPLHLSCSPYLVAL